LELTTLSPEYATTLVPALANTSNPNIWVYRCHDEKRGWTLSAATHAPPGSGMLSLGGFRIAPAARMESEGFSTEHEAVALAIGMEEKVRWSRVLHIGGPLGSEHVRRMVGGKCVIAPTPDARIGQPRDRELLDFAVDCFKVIEEAGGFHLTTGQDLGHGTMHDGATSSLRYLNQRFAGSAVADTSVPTGEGNFQLLCGMLRALNIDVSDATVGLLGAGHVGTRVLERLREHGAKVLVMEPWEKRRVELDAMGVRTWVPSGARTPDRSGTSGFFGERMDALVVNAAGGSLDDFQRIKGVGPKLADMLRARGFNRFEQLAHLTPEEVAMLDEQLGPFRGRIRRDRIAEQATFLARGDVDGFEQHFGKL
jgi:hypothetical protein